MTDVSYILQHIIDKSKKIVFFGGAGVSTESGIPDFRSIDGLYQQKWKYPPEQIISHSFFEYDPIEFYRFYREKLVPSKEIKPNAAHYKLAELEEKGKLIGVVTQNIDGLHQMAGSRNVFELHGSIHRNYCTKCGKFFNLEEMLNLGGIVPHCDNCGAIVKPDVVLYEEALDNSVVNKTINALSNADLLIIGGTSLVVYPAAGFIDYFNGDSIVLINKSWTGYDSKASLIINDSLGNVLSQLIL